jgi:hypothetical protein
MALVIVVPKNPQSMPVSNACSIFPSVGLTRQGWHPADLSSCLYTTSDMALILCQSDDPTGTLRTSPRDSQIYVDSIPADSAWRASIARQFAGRGKLTRIPVRSETNQPKIEAAQSSEIFSAGKNSCLRFQFRRIARTVAARQDLVTRCGHIILLSRLAGSVVGDFFVIHECSNILQENVYCLLARAE